MYGCSVWCSQGKGRVTDLRAPVSLLAAYSSSVSNDLVILPDNCLYTVTKHFVFLTIICIYAIMDVHCYNFDQWLCVLKLQLGQVWETTFHCCQVYT